MLRDTYGTAPRRHRRLFAVGAALACLVAAVSAHLAGDAERSIAVPREVRELKVATWNMCGVRQWGCGATGSSGRKVRELTLLATADGARVILLQETCSGDLDAARRELGSAWHSTFRAYVSVDGAGKRRTVRCAVPEQGSAGYGIMAAFPLSRVTPVRSHQPATGLQRGIVCATVAAHGIRVCNAHLSLPGGDRAHPDREYRDDQLTALVRAAAGPRTVFGGDLNIGPPSFRNPDSRLWPHELHRRYRECDQSSAATRGATPTHRSGHKVDHLFTGLPRNGCSVRDTGASDHRALILSVRTGRAPAAGA
ncbi:endonuclease/exonuclease/phosphatase family protein [Streptomyces sp. SCSIO 30461]|uniref:endonuclease/exonuclease/phosphatase family protein n=1 Tax=Streptomyces sp. SCSIO 30461 TaxID=3118085 RepID=UPI0030CD71E7